MIGFVCSIPMKLQLINLIVSSKTFVSESLRKVPLPAVFGARRIRRRKRAGIKRYTGRDRHSSSMRK